LATDFEKTRRVNWTCHDRRLRANPAIGVRKEQGPAVCTAGPCFCWAEFYSQR